MTRTEVDAVDCCQVRFAQTHRGLDVWPAELVVQVSSDGAVDMISGAYAPTPRRLVTRPALDQSAALDLARSSLRDESEVELAEPDLFVYSRHAAHPRLAYRVEATVSHTDRRLMVVDAHAGVLLDEIALTMHDNVTTTGVDLLGETRDLNVWREAGVHYLVDTSKQMFDPTSDPPQPLDTRGAIIVLDAVNRGPDLPFQAFFVDSLAPDSWAPSDGVSAAFGLSEAYDYFLERHGRDSFDGLGGGITAYVRVGNNHAASWNGYVMLFGDTDPYAASIDVVAHELTHGVVQETAGLIYQDQPGALNEAFADIFGEMVESRTTSGSHDWLLGTELASPVRNMRDPRQLLIGPGLPYPKKMSQFIDTTEDNGGVHLNSSIVNHAFYLLAEGQADAIGTRDAERIFYRAHSTKLVRQSQFIDCRLGAIASAKELFGANSFQATATAAAFDAVEIFDTPPIKDPPPAEAVNSPDSTLFVYFDTDIASPFLARRESALGDPPLGSDLSTFDVEEARPSVSGDGELAVFVDSINDVCLIDTDGQVEETCIGVPDTVYSVAMSPDGNRFAFVLLDAFGDAENSITIVDIADNAEVTFPLTAPLLDGGAIEVVQADVMEFSRDGNVLVYDAFNLLSFADGSELGLWSIYALDLVTGSVYTLVEPVPGFDFGCPALSHTSDRFLTFEAFDPVAGDSLVVAVDLSSGELEGVVSVLDATFQVAPSYTGDDRAIVVTAPDFTNTGASLFRQDLASDHITPVGNPTLWLEDAQLGVIYRRGEFLPPPPPEEIEFTLPTGTPTIDALTLTVPIGPNGTVVDLRLAHDVKGRLTKGGPCTVGGVPVTVTGKLSFSRRTRTWRYKLRLHSADRSVKVNISGGVSSNLAKVVFRSPQGRGTFANHRVDSISTFEPISRAVIAPSVDILGRISGTARILGGFGNDLNTTAVMTGKIKREKLTLKMVDPVSRRKLKFKGFRLGDFFFGRMKVKIPPAKTAIDDYVILDIFGL